MELPAYYTSEAARAPDAVLLHDNKPGNVEREVHHQFGDVGMVLPQPIWCVRSNSVAPRSTTRRSSRTQVLPSSIR